MKWKTCLQETFFVETSLLLKCFCVNVNTVLFKDMHFSAGSAWGWKDVAVGVAAGTAAVAATPVVLSAAGFTAGGIAAGSFAASVQSVFYGSSVATGSVFAALQSAGVAGIGTTASAAIGGVTGAAAMLVKKIGGQWYSSRRE